MNSITSVQSEKLPRRILTDSDRYILAAAQAAARLRAGLEISLRDSARLTRLHMERTMGGAN